MKIELKAKEGNKKAKKIQKLLKDPSKFLATIQIGITLAGFLSSAFASDAFADLLAPKLYSVMPMISFARWREISIIIITLILSYFTLVFGELVPKRIAMEYSEKLSFMAVGIIRVISVFTLPFVKLLTFSTDIISKIFDPLFTTDSSRKISGLGLSICKEFIEMHGGTLKAYNDEGLVLEFILPKTKKNKEKNR